MNGRLRYSHRPEFKKCSSSRPCPGGPIDPKEAVQKYDRVLTNSLLTPLVHVLGRTVTDANLIGFHSDDSLLSDLPKWRGAEKSWRRMLPMHPTVTSPFKVNVHVCRYDDHCLDLDYHCTEQKMGEIPDSIHELGHNTMQVHRMGAHVHMTPLIDIDARISLRREERLEEEKALCKAPGKQYEE
jgi:hypothetical protein